MSGRCDVDLLVVGGGPAGLAAAIEATRAGLETVIFEPRSGPIDKACGEGLMPSARAVLAELGVALEGIPFEGIRYVDAHDPSRFAEGRFPHGAGLGVRRTRLHASMHARALQLGVRFVPERVSAVVQDERSVEACGLRARWMIAADGLRSPLRASLGLQLPPRRPLRFGVRRHFAVAPWSSRVEVHWAEGCEAYVTPVDASTVGVVFLYSPPGRFDDLLSRFPHLRERLAGAAVRSEDRGAGPFEQRVRARVQGNVLLVGDAAGYLDPITGEGVALGVATARAAVLSLREERPQAYEARWQRATRLHLGLTAALLDATRSRASHRPLIALLARAPWLFDRALGVLGGDAGDATTTHPPAHEPTLTA